MRRYLFEFQDNGKDEYGNPGDFKSHTKYEDWVQPVYEEGRTDLDEFQEEAVKFLLAMGFGSFNARGLVYLHWRFGINPDYEDYYLVTFKDEEYARVARWKDSEWYDLDGNIIDSDTIDTWAEMPEGMHRKW